MNINRIIIPAVDDESLGSLLWQYAEILNMDYDDDPITILWLSQISDLYNILQRIHRVCTAFVQKQGGFQPKKRSSVINALKSEVEDLIEYVVRITDVIKVLRNNEEYSYDHNNILTTLATDLKPQWFWKCFWLKGTLFMVDHTGYQEDRRRENDEKINFLEFIAKPIRYILLHIPNHYVYCRDALQILLDDNSRGRNNVDKMLRLSNNDSYDYALKITGIVTIPRSSYLSDGTRSTMQDVPFRRRYNQVYMPP